MKPSQPEATAKLLELALNDMKECGWQQGMYGSGTGPKCAVGAISAQAGYSNSAVSLARRALEATMRTGRSIENWNDAKGRTFAEVAALFRKTIDRLRTS